MPKQSTRGLRLSCVIPPKDPPLDVRLITWADNVAYMLYRRLGVSFQPFVEVFKITFHESDEEGVWFTIVLNLPQLSKIALRVIYHYEVSVISFGPEDQGGNYKEYGEIALDKIDDEQSNVVGRVIEGMLKAISFALVVKAYEAERVATETRILAHDISDYSTARITYEARFAFAIGYEQQGNRISW